MIPGYGDLVEVGRSDGAVVFKAVRRRTNREVAVKVFDGPAEATVAGLQRVADGLGKIRRHPNVVQVYDVGVTDDGRAFQAMELCEPVRTDRLSVDDVVRMGAAAAGALAAAHTVGVVHGDVRPSAILRNRGVYKLTGFGVTRLDPAPTITTDLRGLGSTLDALLAGLEVPAWLAAAVAELRAPDEARRWWSMGVVREVLTVGDPDPQQAAEDDTAGAPETPDAGPATDPLGPGTVTDRTGPATPRPDRASRWAPAGAVAAPSPSLSVEITAARPRGRGPSIGLVIGLLLILSGLALLVVAAVLAGGG